MAFGKLLKTSVKKLSESSKITTRQYASGKTTTSFSQRIGNKSVSTNGMGKKRTRKIGY